MKTLIIILFLAVSLALAVEGPGGTPAAQPNDREVNPWPSTCCFDFEKRPIPLNILASYERTSGNCNSPGIIFITKKGRRICADPSEPWVQDRIRHLSPA